MSYRIGQIRKNNNTSYLSDLAFEETFVYTAGYANKIFTDYAITLTGGASFNANNTYYMRFTIKRINSQDPRFSPTQYPMTKDTNDPREMNIKLELFKNTGEETGGQYQLGTYQIIQSNVAIEPYIEGENTEYASYEIVFSPNDTYPYLGLILSRTNYDYLQTPRNEIKGNIDFSEKGDLCIVQNILPRETVSKIGIQSRPGTLICVNREPFRIGRSGTFEINNGVPVGFVGIVAPNGSSAINVDKFILDYAWDE